MTEIPVTKASNIAKESKCLLCSFQVQKKLHGDSARRTGNEFVYQQLAIQNIENMNNLEVKKLLRNAHIVLIQLQMSTLN